MDETANFKRGNWPEDGSPMPRSELSKNNFQLPAVFKYLILTLAFQYHFQAGIGLIVKFFLFILPQKN